MNIDIQANGLAADEEIHHFVSCRADLALGAMRDQVGLVSVFADRTGDANEVRCLVLIRPFAQPDIVVEASSANLYLAVHRALDDAAWTLAQTLMRQQSGLMHRQIELIESQAGQSEAIDLARPRSAA
jgi:hypothetical protein